jgi:hypothetical protein
LQVKVWDAATGSELLSLPANFRTGRHGVYGLFPKVAFSPDGHRLLPLDFHGSRLGGVPVWDATPLAAEK